MVMELNLHDTMITHEKSIYNVFDLLGDVGGLLDLFIFVLAIVMLAQDD